MQLLTLPVESPMRHEVNRHMNHVRKLTLFRQSKDTSADALLGVVRANMRRKGRERHQRPALQRSHIAGTAPISSQTMPASSSQLPHMESLDSTTATPTSPRRTLYRGRLLAAQSSLTRASTPITPFLRNGAHLSSPLLSCALQTAAQPALRAQHCMERFRRRRTHDLHDTHACVQRRAPARAQGT
jgi:hypothetical protein